LTDRVLDFNQNLFEKKFSCEKLKKNPEKLIEENFRLLEKNKNTKNHEYQFLRN